MTDPADREGTFTAEYPGNATLTRLEDGRIRVDRADPIISISLELLDQADPEKLVVAGDIVRFGDINPVTYRITERHPLYVIAEKLEENPSRITISREDLLTNRPDMISVILESMRGT